MLSEKQDNKQRYSKILRRSFINQKRPSLLLSGMRSYFFVGAFQRPAIAFGRRKTLDKKIVAICATDQQRRKRFFIFISNIVNDSGRMTQCLPLNCLSKEQIQIQLKNIFSPIRRKSRTKSLKCNKTTKEVGKEYLSHVQGEKYA